MIGSYLWHGEDWLQIVKIAAKSTLEGLQWRGADTWSMFYVQLTAREGSYQGEAKCIATTSTVPIQFNLYDTFRCWGSENLGECEVEWIRKAETR